MPKFKIKFGKQIHEITAQDLVDFKNKVYQCIRVPPAVLKIIKPQMKDQKMFQAIKQGTQITVMGTVEQKLKAQQSRPPPVVEKIVEQKPPQPQVIQNIPPIPQKNPEVQSGIAELQKLTKDQRNQGILQNGIQWRKHIGFITYVTSSIQFFKNKELKAWCNKYQSQTNANGLMVNDLATCFNSIDDQKSTIPVSPVDIITSWVGYAEDFGDYPYQTFDAYDFFVRMFQLLESAVIDDYDDKPNQPNFIHQLMRMSFKTYEQDIRSVIQDWMQPLEKAERHRHRYMLPCQVKQVNTVPQGVNRIKKMKTQQIRQVYGVDVYYMQEIKGITHLPAYIMIHIDRFEKKQIKRQYNYSRDQIDDKDDKQEDKQQNLINGYNNSINSNGISGGINAFMNHPNGLHHDNSNKQKEKQKKNNNNKQKNNKDDDDDDQEEEKDNKQLDTKFIHLEGNQKQEYQIRLQQYKLSEKFAKPITYFKNYDFYDECEKEVKQKLDQGRKKRDEYLKKYKNKQYQKLLQKFPDFNLMTETQKLYAIHDHLVSDQQYQTFYSKQLVKINPNNVNGLAQQIGFKTGQYNLFGVLTHKGQKISNQSHFKAIVQRTGKKWYKFNEGDVSITNIEEALSYKGTNDNKDQCAHILLYRAISF